MKKLLKATLTGLMALFFAVNLTAVTTVTTDPVGFITLNIKGAGGGDSAVTVLGLGMSNPIEFQGAINSVNGDTISLASDALNGSDFSAGYFIEFITSGVDSEGLMVDILSNTNNTITLAQDVSSVLAADIAFRVRKLHSIESVFGAGDSLILGQNDIVTLFRGDLQSSEVYSYNSRSETWSTASGDGLIRPDQGIIVVRYDSDDVAIKLVGAVKTGATAMSVFTDTNVIANPYPVAIPFDTIGLDQNDGDTIGIFDSATQSTYIYTYVARQEQWVVPAGAPDSIPVGGAIILKRAGDAYSWVEIQPWSN